MDKLKITIEPIPQPGLKQDPKLTRREFLEISGKKFFSFLAVLLAVLKPEKLNSVDHSMRVVTKKIDPKDLISSTRSPVRGNKPEIADPVEIPEKFKEGKIECTSAVRGQIGLEYSYEKTTENVCKGIIETISLNLQQVGGKINERINKITIYGEKSLYRVDIYTDFSEKPVISRFRSAGKVVDLRTVNTTVTLAYLDAMKELTQMVKEKNLKLKS